MKHDDKCELFESVRKSIKRNPKKIFVFSFGIFFIVTTITIYRPELQYVILLIVVTLFVSLLFCDIHIRSKIGILEYENEVFRKREKTSYSRPIVTEFDKIPNAAEIVVELSHHHDWLERDTSANATNVHFNKIPKANEITNRLSNDEDWRVRTDVAKIFKKPF